MKASVLTACVALIGLGSEAPAQTPDCTGSERWPTSMAFTHLKNAGLTDNDQLDFTKTKTERIASEPIGRAPAPLRSLFRQVHHVTFVEKSGRSIEVITVNTASRVECSESSVQVFLVSRQIGDSGK